jgi:hypothetical protein
MSEMQVEVIGDEWIARIREDEAAGPGNGCSAHGAAAVRLRLSGNRSVILRYEIVTPGGRFGPLDISMEGLVVRVRTALGEVADEIRVGVDGALDITRSWNISSRAPFRLPCIVQLQGFFSRWVVPSVMWDGNQDGIGKFPRGGLEVGWSFREDRCSIPSCSILIGSPPMGRYGSPPMGWAFFTEPAKREEELSSIKSTAARRNASGRYGSPPMGRDADAVVLEISTPFEEWPFTYREKGWPFGGLRRPTEMWFPPSAGFRFKRRFTLIPIEEPEIPFQKLFAAARSRCMPNGLDIWANTDWGRYIALKANWLLKYALYRKGRVVGIIRHLRTNAIIQRFFGDFIGGSFLSKGLEAAVSFQRLSSECGDPGLSGLAKDIASFTLSGELENGLAFDDYSIHRNVFGGFFQPGRDLAGIAATRCMGESGQQYLKLYERDGQDPRWLAHSVRIADFFLSHQLPDGNYGRFWYPDGKLRDARGTNGAYIIWLMAELARLTGNRAYLGSARRAANYFMETVVKSQHYTFDTLDAECTDKEAGQVLLRAFLLLHKLTGETSLLEAARGAAGYCLSWQFAWDVPFSPKTPLGRIGFHTFGGTSVSVAHHHLDPYGLIIALDFLRLGAALGEDCWTRYARDLMGFCAQLVSTPERPLDKGTDFIGYQPEQCNHTNWDYMHRILGGKGAYSSPASWVASATLGAALDIREEFPDQLPLSETVDLTMLGNKRGLPYP